MCLAGLVPALLSSSFSLARSKKQPTMEETNKQSVYQHQTVYARKEGECEEGMD